MIYLYRMHDVFKMTSVTRLFRLYLCYAANRII